MNSRSLQPSTCRGGSRKPKAVIKGVCHLAPNWLWLNHVFSHKISSLKDVVSNNAKAKLRAKLG